MKRWNIVILLSFVVGGAIMAAAVWMYWPHESLRGADSTVSSAPKTLSRYEQGDPDKQEIFELVNMERQKQGSRVLAMDSRLNESAQEKSDEIVSNGISEHISSTTGLHGYEIAQRKMDNKCLSLSENLAGVPAGGNSQNAFDMWKRSKVHYAAMIDSKYTLTGFGITKTAGNTFSVVQHFCQEP